MRNPRWTGLKILIISGVTAITLGIHYGWLIEPVFGHVHWIHVVHGRFCYIPIVIAASWFGLRGGVVAASAISAALLPYIFKTAGSGGDISVEIAEIIFYYAIAVLAGILVEREFVSRRKQQETQLHVERSQKLSLVGQIAAGVAHEIKNPLATIKGAADILAADETSQTDREEFKNILQREVKRIDSTVAEFLQFARPRATKLDFLDLSDTLRLSLRQIDSHAKQQGLSLEGQLQEGVFVRGDREKMHQLVLNLVLNAMQASKSGDKVRVGLTKEGRWARVVVSDTGEGMGPDEKKRILDPFYTTRPSGTGLGLAIVKTIVDDHGGRIEFDSEKDRGTKVTVTMPLAGRQKTS